MTVDTGFATSGAQENATFMIFDNVHAKGLRSKFSDGSTFYTQTESGVRIKSDGAAEFI